MLRTAVLLTLSNVFMTVAWYAHLRDLRDKPVWIAILVSWGIALFEYAIQVPANRYGYQTLTLGQLKVLQEIITMSVFAVFSWVYMGQKLDWNFAGAAACMLGAAWFMFRSRA